MLCVTVCLLPGLCYHQEPCLGATSEFLAMQRQRSVTTKANRHLYSGLMPGDMLMSDCCAELSFPLPGHHGRAGPGGMKAGELTPLLASYSTRADGDTSMKYLAIPLVSCALVWIRKRYFFPLCPSSPAAGRRPDAVVMKARELSLPLNSCNTQESGPCTSPG